MKLFLCTILFLSSSTSIFCNKASKIVALAALRNEKIFVWNYLKMLEKYADAIIVLDDASTDNTVEIVRSLAKECRIERIIEKKEWKRDERGDRELLLRTGREIGGTHFIVLDADEWFTAPCLTNNWLRNTIISLKPGQSLTMPYPHVWGDYRLYRRDRWCNPSPFPLTAVFCDDGKCSYYSNHIHGPSGTIHVNRIPAGLHQQISISDNDLDHSIIHLGFVNLEESRTKIIWYMCLEFIRKNQEHKNADLLQRNAEQINNFYKKAGAHVPVFDDAEVRVVPVPHSWYAYDFFDSSWLSISSSMRISQKEEVISWIKQYGPEYFKELNIWRTNWTDALR